MRVSSFILLGVAGLIACGGATATNLFDAPALDGGADGSGSGSGSGSGGGVDSGSGSHVDSGSGSGSGVDSGSGSGGHDASVDTGVDASTSDPGIRCGEINGAPTYCAVGTQICCVTGGTGGPGTATSQCASAVFSGCLGLSIPCDDMADCTNGEVCCGVLAQNGNRYTSVQCQASCDPNNNEYELCDPNAQPSECGQGTQCTQSSVLTGYYRCN